jgi:hypothetical protein
MTMKRMMVLSVVVVLAVGGAMAVRSIRRMPAAPDEMAKTTRVERSGQRAVPTSGTSSKDNVGAQMVVEAHRTGEHPERLSPLIAPAPFDPVKFESDPQSYLEVVEPGRCFQTARATGADAVYLEPASSLAARGNPGDEVTLMVKSAPLAPVTFTAFQGGKFRENGLGSVSVRGDARGYATAHFEVPPAANGQMAVLVGSPLAVGNQTFMVDATLAVAAD